MAGNVASQGVGVITGIQDKFSFKGVALAALSAGVGAGVGSVIKGAVAGSQFLGDVIRGAVSSGITQGVATATGLQDKFSWAGVAAAGIGAGVGGAVARGLASEKGLLGFRAAEGTFGNDLGSSMADAIASAVTKSAVEGSSFGANLLEAVPSAIGNTLGRTLGRAILNELVQANNVVDQVENDPTKANIGTEGEQVAGIVTTNGGGLGSSGTLLVGGHPLMMAFSAEIPLAALIAGAHNEQTSLPASEETAHGEEIVVTGRKHRSSYTVSRGETPSAIAARLGITVDELLSAAGVDDPRRLPVGRITIPDYVIREGDTLSGIARKLDTTVDLLAADNGITRDQRNQIVVGDELIVNLREVSTPTDRPTKPRPNSTPVSPHPAPSNPAEGGARLGGVSFNYRPVAGPLNTANRPGEGGGGFHDSRGGGRRLHEGIDINAPSGTPVVAVADGRVVTVINRNVSNDSGATRPKRRQGAGTIVVIDHGNGVQSKYFHLQFRSPSVGVGERVVAGQVIARVGRTGNTPSAGDTHLHFELRRNNGAVNPQTYLPRRR
jgi:murein DD-endopeptidase MepM/ murein hydrolase activator NlpD